MYHSKGSLTTRSYINVKGNFSKYLHLYKQNKRDQSIQIKIKNTNKMFYNELTKLRDSAKTLRDMIKSCDLSVE